MPEPKHKWQWTEAGTGRVVSISSIIALLVAVIVFWSDIKNFVWLHPWWQSVIAAFPAIALVVVAILELRHSGEANTQRRRANDLREEANDLQQQIGELTAKLSEEQNKHLQQIAEHTKRPTTRAERNAEILRKHLRANVAVTEGAGVKQTNWGVAPQIVEVNNDNIITFFVPRGHTSSQAYCINAHCDDVEITEIPQGSCPLQVKILKRYGADAYPLGEITKWEDRNKPSAKPIFEKGGMAFQANYNKQGSSETRYLYVFKSKDGANSFLLESSTGDTVVADNRQISKEFVLREIDFLADGFQRQQSGTGGSPYPVFMR